MSVIDLLSGIPEVSADDSLNERQKGGPLRRTGPRKAPFNDIDVSFDTWNIDNLKLLHGDNKVSQLFRMPIRRSCMLRSDSLRSANSHPSHVTGALIYTRGERNVIPCAFCLRGSGPFPGCISMKKEKGLVHGKGACGNCYYISKTGDCCWNTQSGAFVQGVKDSDLGRSPKVLYHYRATRARLAEAEGREPRAESPMKERAASRSGISDRRELVRAARRKPIREIEERESESENEEDDAVPVEAPKGRPPPATRAAETVAEHASVNGLASVAGVYYDPQDRFQLAGLLRDALELVEMEDRIRDKQERARQSRAAAQFPNIPASSTSANPASFNSAGSASSAPGSSAFVGNSRALSWPPKEELE